MSPCLYHIAISAACTTGAYLVRSRSPSGASLDGDRCEATMYRCSRFATGVEGHENSHVCDQMLYKVGVSLRTILALHLHDQHPLLITISHTSSLPRPEHMGLHPCCECHPVATCMTRAYRLSYVIDTPLLSVYAVDQPSCTSLSLLRHCMGMLPLVN